MKKTFDLYGIEYTVTDCTAISFCDGEDEKARQDALMVTFETDSGEKVDYVVFGWNMPEDAETFSDMCEDGSAWEPLSEDHHIKL
jgi:hypothetical protein